MADDPTPDQATTKADADGTAAAPSATDSALKALATLSTDPANTVGPPPPAPIQPGQPVLGVAAPAVPVPSPVQGPGTPPGMTPAAPASVGASAALDAYNPALAAPPQPVGMVGAAPQNPYAGPPPSAPSGPGIPVNPYVNAPPPPASNVPLTQAQAADAEQAALATAQQSHTDALQAQVLAGREHAQAQAGVLTDYANALAKEDQATAVARDAIHRAHAAENAQWMKDMTSAVSKEPDPSRWWENTSGFAKVLWIMSIAFGAKAMQHGATKNVGIEMMRAEIDSDVRAQKDRLAKQLEFQKEKGKLSAQDYAEKLADLSSDHSGRLARLMVMEKALEARAAIPGASDLAAATAAGKDWLGQQMVAVAKDRYDKSVKIAEDDLNRRAESQRQNTALGFQDKWHVMEDKRARDIANQTDKRDRDLADERIAAAMAKSAAGKPDDRLPIPASSGAMLVGPKGEQVQIKVPKEHAQKVSDSINDATQLASGIKYLQDKLSDTNSVDYLMKSENQFNSALAQVADKIMVQSGGKRGLSSEQVRDQVYQQLLGENYGSAWAKLKGKSREEVTAVLQHNLDKINPALENEVKTVAGSNLAELESQGYHVGINMNDVRPMETQPHTSSQVLASMGVKSEVPHPQTADEYRTAKSRGDEFLPRLHPALETEVSDAEKKWPTISPEHVREGFLDAHSRVSKWADDAEAHARTPEAKKAIQDQAHDALLRLSATETDAHAKAAKALDAIKDDLLTKKESQDRSPGGGVNKKPWEPSAAEVRKLGDRYGLKFLDSNDIVKLIDDVKHIRK